MKERDIAVYQLVRTDMPSLNTGKALAQAHHAGVQLAIKHKDKPIFKQYIADGIAQGADHFNTTLTMSADIVLIKKILGAARKAKFLVDSIIDPEYPFIVSKEIASLIPMTDKVKIVKEYLDGTVLMLRPELTIGYVIGDRNNPEFRAIVDELELHR